MKHLKKISTNKTYLKQKFLNKIAKIRDIREIFTEEQTKNACEKDKSFNSNNMINKPSPKKKMTRARLIRLLNNQTTPTPEKARRIRKKT